MAKKYTIKELKPLAVPLLAVHHYGAEHQKRKAIEEMGELITELGRHAATDSAFEQALATGSVCWNPRIVDRSKLF